MLGDEIRERGLCRRWSAVGGLEGSRRPVEGGGGQQKASPGSTRVQKASPVFVEGAGGSGVQDASSFFGMVAGGSQRLIDCAGGSWGFATVRDNFREEDEGGGCIGQRRRKEKRKTARGLGFYLL